jgi:hypothetical protein
MILDLTQPPVNMASVKKMEHQISGRPDQAIRAFCDLRYGRHRMNDLTFAFFARKESSCR